MGFFLMKIRQRICKISSWTRGASPGFEHPPHKLFPLGSTYGITRTCLLLENVNVSSCSLSYDHLQWSVTLRYGLGGHLQVGWLRRRTEAEAASLIYSFSALRIIMVLVNELGRNDRHRTFTGTCLFGGIWRTHHSWTPADLGATPLCERFCY